MNEPTAKHAAPAQVAGIDLSCEICKYDHFFERTAHLNSAGARIFRFVWVVLTSLCLSRANCGSIPWLLPEKIFPR